MRLEGKVSLPAPPEQIWDMLLDPEVIAEILPGCHAVKVIKEDQYEGIIEAKVGPITSRYKTRFSLTDKNPPLSCRLQIEGEGKGGFIRGEALVKLEPQNNETILHYAGEGSVGGMIARIGQRLIEAAGKMLVQKGFSALKSKIEAKLQNTSTSPSDST